jgi:hypothetical protein
MHCPNGEPAKTSGCKRAVTLSTLQNACAIFAWILYQPTSPYSFEFKRRHALSFCPRLPVALP